MDNTKGQTLGYHESSLFTYNVKEEPKTYVEYLEERINVLEEQLASAKRELQRHKNYEATKAVALKYLQDNKNDWAGELARLAGCNDVELLYKRIFKDFDGSY
jgi:hypothetical protein